VFSLRCAQHIANQSPSVPALDYHGNVKSCFEGVVSEIKAGLDQDNGLGIDEIRQEVQGRMSDDAGFICDGEAISLAKTASNALNQSIARSGLKYKVSNIAQAFQWKQTALLSEAVLTALNHYVKNGGGSRGARALCSSKAELQPEANGVDLSQYAFIEEKDDDKLKKIVIRLERYSDNWLIEEQSLRDMESPAEIHFEKNWGPFLTSEQYQDGFLHA
jgi:hypothetical protein